MSTDSHLSLPQDAETPPILIKSVPGQGMSYRYAYARSADTRASGDRGQDYLALYSSRTTLVFALCDGVSQSFYGDLASRLLGAGLLGWLLEGLPSTLDPDPITDGLTAYLQDLTEPATQAVQAQELPGEIPAMFREVLEQKRASGSDSTFVCGRIDAPGPAFPQGRVVLAWMGDSRLRLWGPGGSERTPELEDSFKTEQRWSSARGPVNGLPNVVVSPLMYKGKYAVSRILAYSDGLSALDKWQGALANEDLDLLIRVAGRSANSDDISVLDIWPDPGFRLLPRGQVPPAPRAARAEGSTPAGGLTSVATETVPDWRQQVPAGVLPLPKPLPGMAGPGSPGLASGPARISRPGVTATPQPASGYLGVLGGVSTVQGRLVQWLMPLTLSVVAVLLVCGMSALVLSAVGFLHVDLFGSSPASVPAVSSPTPATARRVAIPPAASPTTTATAGGRVTTPTAQNPSMGPPFLQGAIATVTALIGAAKANAPANATPTESGVFTPTSVASPSPTPTLLPTRPDSDFGSGQVYPPFQEPGTP